MGSRAFDGGDCRGDLNVSFLGSIVQTIVDPVLEGILGDQGSKAFNGIKQEIITRLAGITGVPGNHDIERAVRVAQLQAMIVSLNTYQELVRVIAQIDAPVDLEHNPEGFIEEANRHIDRVFRKRATVRLDLEFSAHVRESISNDIYLGARGERGETTFEAATLDFVEAEFCRAAGRNVLPPRFKEILCRGEGECLPWIVTYRAFLCEQVKSNPRFASILNAAMLEGLRSGNVEISACQSEISESLYQVAQDQQLLMGKTGECLARLEAVAIFATELADQVAAETLGLQEKIEHGVALLEKQEAAILHIRDTMMFRSFSNVCYEEEAISAFRYNHAVDPFVGRVDKMSWIEANLLDAGLDSDEPPKFRWMALCGEGGTGKSRLAMEVIGRNSHVWKHAGFVETVLLRRPETAFVVGQNLIGPTLFVVDYAVAAKAEADLPGFMKAWANYATTERAQPVRILVITRRSEEIILNEIRGKGIDPNADMSLVAAAEIAASPIELGPLEDDETFRLMRARIEITAKEMGIAPINLRDIDLASKLAGFDPRRRPLFAAMVASALQRGALPQAETGEEANRLSLFGQYLERQHDTHWLPRAKALYEAMPGEAVLRHANLVRLATCCGGIAVDDISCHVPEKIQVGAGPFPQFSTAEQSGAIRNQLIWTMTGEGLRDEVDDDWLEASPAVPTLEPDLIGERFFLMTFDELRGACPWVNPRKLAILAWKCAPEATAAFLRMAAQDYPRRMHEMHWLPPASSETEKLVLKMRARMLRNLCADIATRYGPAMPTTEDLKRLFDIVDEFGDSLIELAESDHETREHYGQILRQVTNIAGRLGNASIPYIDPISSVEDEQGASVAPRRLTETFSRSGSITDASARLDAEDGPLPLPKDLAAIVCDRLPRLLDRAGRFVLRPGPYLERRPFDSAVADILASAHFRHRDDRSFGGRWTYPRDEASEDVVSEWREHARTLADGTIDDVAVMAGLISTISYAEYENSVVEDYVLIYTAARRVLNETKSVHPMSASRISSMLGNSLVISSESEDLTDAERAHISNGVGLFLQLIARVNLKETITPEQTRRMLSTFARATFAVLIQSSKISDPRASEAAKRFTRLLAGTPDETPLSLNFLSVLANLPKDTKPEIVAELHGAVRTRIVNGAVDAYDFRSPNAREPVDELCKLVFGVPLERLRLPENLAFDLLVVLDREVGAKATRAALESIIMTLEADAEIRSRVPIGLARRYLVQAKGIHGFDGRDFISAATMAVWAHDLLRGDDERVKYEIDELWGAIEEPAALHGRTLAVWGAALMIDGTRKPDDFTRSWSARLRETDRLSVEVDLSRLADAGLGEGEAERYVHEHNQALIDACMAAARLHVLNGGDPADWIQGD